MEIVIEYAFAKVEKKWPGRISRRDDEDAPILLRGEM